MSDEIKTISLPCELAGAILDELYELRGERHWWKDEPRCNYQRDYSLLCAEIEALEKLLGRNFRPAPTAAQQAKRDSETLENRLSQGRGDALRCENCHAPATHFGEFCEGNESGGLVPVCWTCAVVLKCSGVRPINKIISL